MVSMRVSRWLATLGAGLLCSPAMGQTPSLQQLVEVANISGVSVSPDGRSLVFRVDRASVDRNTVDLQWWRLDIASGRALPLDGGGAPIFLEPGMLSNDRPVWSADSRAFLYPALRDGEVQIFRTMANGSGTHRVTREDGDVSGFQAQSEAERVRYRVGAPRDAILRAEQEAYDQGVVVDGHVQLAQNIHQGALINGRRATQRLVGDWFQRGNILWDQPDRIRILDLTTFETSATDDVVPQVMSSRGEGGPVAFRRSDGAQVRWAGGRDGLEVVGSGSAIGASSEPVRCRQGACASRGIQWLEWRPGSDQVVFAVRDADRVDSLLVWDTRSGSVRTAFSSPGLISGSSVTRIGGTPCAITAQLAYCVEASPGMPPRLVAITLDTGRSATIYDPNEDYRRSMIPRVERLHWTSADGLPFTGVVFRPPAGTPSPGPMFVTYYSCDGFMREGVTDEWPLEYLAAAGITAVCVNQTPQRSSTQDALQSYRDALAGLEALVERMVRAGDVDRRRIGIGGLSFGTEVAIWAIRHSTLFAAASTTSSEMTPAFYWANSVSGRNYQERVRAAWGLGSPDETPEQWRIASPVFDVQRIQTPLLMQMPEVEARHMGELVARLNMARVPAELVIFPDERHIKFLPRHRLAAMRRNLDWFRFWLQDHEDPDPSRAAQYRRWRGLAERWRASRSAVQPPQERSQSSMETRSSTR